MEGKDKPIIRQITHLFIIYYSLPFTFFIISALLHNRGISIDTGYWKFSPGIFLFIFSVTLGAALPVLIRTIFHRQFINREKNSPEDFVKREKWLIILSALSLVTATTAYIISAAPLYTYGSMLSALYGIYGVLPFESKIAKELRIYKLVADQ